MSSRGSLGGVSQYLGIGELSFEMDDREGLAFRLACLLPGLALLALLITFMLEVAHDPSPASYGFWDRLQNVAAFLQSPLVYISLASLIVFGIGRVSYGQASWAFAGVVILVAGAFFTAVYVSMLYLLLERRSDPGDYYLFTVIRATFVFAVLGAGYAFLAYRGLSGPDQMWDEDQEEASA